MRDETGVPLKHLPPSRTPRIDARRASDDVRAAHEGATAAQACRLATQLTVTNGQIDVRHVLPAIRVPTLILHADKELYCHLRTFAADKLCLCSLGGAIGYESIGRRVRCLGRFARRGLTGPPYC
jgi:hypothetical protein